MALTPSPPLSVIMTLIFSLEVSPKVHAVLSASARALCDLMVLWCMHAVFYI